MTTETYGAIRRKEERSKATPPLDFAQGREPVERQMMPWWWIRVETVEDTQSKRLSLKEPAKEKMTIASPG